MWTTGSCCAVIWRGCNWKNIGGWRNPGSSSVISCGFFRRCQDELVSSEDFQRYADELDEDWKRSENSWTRIPTRSGPKTSRCSRRLRGLTKPAKNCSREEIFLVWIADYLDGRAAAKRCRTSRALPAAVPTYSGGRVSGHQHRATRAAAPAFAGAAKYRCGGRQRSGHLPVSRRFVRELQTFSGTLCGLEDRAGFDAVSRDADGKLPFHAEYSARGDAGDRTKRSQLRLPEQGAVADAPGRRTHSHRGAGDRGRRSSVGDQRTGAFTPRRKPLARFCACCTGSMRIATNWWKSFRGGRFRLSSPGCRFWSIRWCAMCWRICG